MTPGFGGESNPGAIALLDQVRSRGIPIRRIAAGESWESGGASFRVLHPPAGWNRDASDNARSLVLDVAFKGRHFLLTGDLEQAGLTAVTAHAAPEPPPDVMLAPHHGGKTANPPFLYNWAKPRLVVVSQKPLPARSADALVPIEERGIPVLRTWRQGAISLRFGSQGIAARGFLDQDEDRGRELVFASVVASVGHVAGGLALSVIVGLFGFTFGLIGCALMAVVEIGAWSLVAPSRNRRPDIADDADISESDSLIQPIEIRAEDGARLAGRFMPARGSTPTGRTVLLLHGFAETSRALERQRMAALSRHGWNVAALDSRGYGQSEGTYATFGGRESGDVRAWLDRLAEWVAQSGSPCAFRPVLWGRSMGAQIAMRTAAEDTRVAALVLESPLVDLALAVAVPLRLRRFPMPRLLARLILGRARRLAGIALDRPRPIDLAPHLTCPVLVLHGSDDKLVTAAEARRLAAAFAKAPMWRDVPGAGHSDVVDIGGEPLLEEVAAFLDQAASSDRIMATEVGEHRA